MSVMGLRSHYYPRDQRCTGHRTDNLVFQTMPLGESVLVVGPVKCLLWASSDAIDTDFAVKLIEVGEDGLPINISQGIVEPLSQRIRQRTLPGAESAIPLRNRDASGMHPFPARFAHPFDVAQISPPLIGTTTPAATGRTRTCGLRDRRSFTTVTIPRVWYCRCCATGFAEPTTWRDQITRVQGRL